MNAYTQISKLRLLGAPPCNDAMEWLAKHPEWTVADAWQHCHRADWMLWFMRASGADIEEHSLRVIAVEWRERTYRHWLRLSNSNPDPRSENAIYMAYKYLRGQCTRDELKSARDAAWDASRAAWDASRAAWDAAAWAAARTAAMAAAWAASDAWDTARTAAMAAARADKNLRIADRLRQIWSPS